MKNVSASIDSSRLCLINCDLQLIHKVMEGDESLKQYLDVLVAEKWTVFGEPAFRWTLNRLTEFPDDAKWLTYLPLLKDENRIIGTCGFKGAPDQNGIVEIGYEVAQFYRRRGLASEIAQSLIKFALKFPEVKTVCAHTLADDEASSGVLKNAGMKFDGTLNDETDGLLWKWSLSV